VTPNATLGASTSLQAVTASITGLTPGTAYHFRLVATNAAGASNGSDQAFTTVAPVTVDRTPPRVRALASAGVRGRVMHLRYRLWEDSGSTHEDVRIATPKRRVGRVRTTPGDVTHGHR